MSNNSNDSGYLSVKQRILAALRGQGYAPQQEQEQEQEQADANELGGDSNSDSNSAGELESGFQEQELPRASIATATAAPLESSAGEIPDSNRAANVTGHEPPEEQQQEQPESGTQLLPPGAGLMVTLEDNPALYAMQSYLASRVSRDSKRTMLQSLARVARMLDATPERVAWHKLRFQHTDAIRARLLEHAYSASTLTMTLAGLRGVLRQCKRLGLMSVEDYDRATDWDPVHGISLPPGRELSNADLEAIHGRLLELDGTAYGAFLEACFALMLGLGLRADESSNVLTSGLDLDAGTLKLLRKGSKQHMVPLGPAEIRAMRNWLAWRRFYERKFRYPQLLLRIQPDDSVRRSLPVCTRKHMTWLCGRMAKEANIKHFSPHDLRRTFCTRAIRESKGDLATIQELMGHADIQTTKRYDRRSDEERHEARQKWTIWRPPEPPQLPPAGAPDPPPEPSKATKAGFRLLPGGKS